mgnify:CR=1 FL=1
MVDPPRHLSITTMHLPGEQNVPANRLSRVYEDNHDWVLNNEVVEDLFQDWGVPQVDLFADADNRKCPVFASRAYHPESLGNVLLIDWSRKFLYAFPPIPLIPAVLIKLRSSASRMILIAPEWPCQW